MLLAWLLKTFYHDTTLGQVFQYVFISLSFLQKGFIMKK